MENHSGREAQGLDVPPQIPESVADVGVPRKAMRTPGLAIRLPTGSPVRKRLVIQ